MKFRFWRLMIGLVTASLAAASATYSERLAALQARLAGQPTNAVLLLELGDLCHDEGAKDNPEAVKLAEKYLKQVLDAEPANAMARVLYGSTFTMKGRDALWPPTQISWVKRGIKEMDAAVAVAPGDPVVRFARANNNFFMPKFLGREDIVQSDFAWLWQQVTNQHPNISLSLKQDIALMHGQVEQKHGRFPEALQVWRQGAEFAPGTVAAQNLLKEIHKVKGRSSSTP